MGLDSVRHVLTQACHVGLTSRCDVFPRPSIRPNQPQSTSLFSPPPTRTQSAAQVPNSLSEWHSQSSAFCLSVSCRSSRESKKEMKTELNLRLKRRRGGRLEAIFFYFCIKPLYFIFATRSSVPKYPFL